MNKPASTFEIEDLKHRYSGAPVLDIDRLSIAAGSITGLVGPNGSGKSTLLRMLGCIERPSQGRIVYQGQPIRPFAEAARFRITLLPQEPFLMKRSVFNNVSYGLKLRGEKNHVEDRVQEALAFVGLPADRFASRPWYALSGGESQRVALAARLVLRPKVLLLDEPTASVDVGSAQLIKAAALRARQEWGTTIVVASHDIQWLYDVCDDLLHLFRGRVLDRRHATIVLGPWEKTPEDGVYGKTLGVGSRLAVPAPPHADAAALIPFALYEPDDRDRAKARPDTCVRGIIRRISLEKSTGMLIATLMVGDLAIDVALTEAQIRKRGFLPGARLTACYRLEEIAWI